MFCLLLYPFWLDSLTPLYSFITLFVPDCKSINAYAEKSTGLFGIKIDARCIIVIIIIIVGVDRNVGVEIHTANIINNVNKETSQLVN